MLSLATNGQCLSPRIREQFPGTEMEKYALFIYESLKKTKCREFVPSRDEIEALIHRQEMTSTVYCHGGGSCKITINSHTTAGEVSGRPTGPRASSDRKIVRSSAGVLPLLSKRGRARIPANLRSSGVSSRHCGPDSATMMRVYLIVSAVKYFCLPHK